MKILREIKKIFMTGNTRKPDDGHCYECIKRGGTCNPQCEKRMKRRSSEEPETPAQAPESEKVQAKERKNISRKKPGAAEKKQAVPGYLRGWGPLTRPPFKGDAE